MASWRVVVVVVVLAGCGKKQEEAPAGTRHDAAPVVAAPPADAAPAPPPVEDVMTGVVDLGLGLYQTCALLDTGQVACWSDGARPTLVAGLDDAEAIALGNLHGCALRKSGAVACWGDGAFGQLGVTPRETCLSKNGVERPCEREAVDVPGVAAVSIATSYDHTCAATVGGEVWCWGAGSAVGPSVNADSCQVQTGSMIFPCARAPVIVPKVATAVEVATAEGATCARHAAGAVTCWGSNTAGQLGNGKKKMDVAGPAPVRGLDDAVQLAAQDFGFCARRAGGEVHCWGDWDAGKLGDGTETPAWVDGKQSGRPTPGPVKTGPDAKLAGVVDLWTGPTSWCARTPDAVWCWPTGSPQAAFPDLLLPPCRDEDAACKRFAQRVAGPEVHRYFSMSLRACALSNGRALCSDDGRALARAMPAPTGP